MERLHIDSRKLHAKYAGKWIATCDEYVIAVGDTADEAAVNAEAIAPRCGFVLSIAGPLIDLPSVFDK